MIRFNLSWRISLHRYSSLEESWSLPSSHYTDVDEFHPSASCPYIRCIRDGVRSPARTIKCILISSPSLKTSWLPDLYFKNLLTFLNKSSKFYAFKSKTIVGLPSTLLVRNDFVLMASGDRTPADVRFVEWLMSPLSSKTTHLYSFLPYHTIPLPSSPFFCGRCVGKLRTRCVLS